MKKVINNKIVAAALALVIALSALTACGKVQATLVQRQNSNSSRGTNIHDGF